MPNIQVFWQLPNCTNSPNNKEKNNQHNNINSWQVSVEHFPAYLMGNPVGLLVQTLFAPKSVGSNVETVGRYLVVA